MARLFRSFSEWLGRSVPTRRSSYRQPARLVLELETLEYRIAPAVAVTYHEGFFDPVLTHVQVETVFYGTAWNTNSALKQDSQTINQFFSFITNSAYMDLMKEYYETQPFVGNVSVGRGSWTGSDYTSANSPSVVNDGQIQGMLWSEIQNHQAPSANAWQSLYFVFLPPGVTDADCQQHGWGAYHSAFEKVVGEIPPAPGSGLLPTPVVDQVTYAVVPYPNYSVNSANAIQWQEIYSSHELAEAVTNPGNALGGFTNLGGSWYADGNQFADGQGREIADLAAPPNLKFGNFNGYWVQALWSNQFTDPQNPGDHRILPPGTTQVWSEGNGQGSFPAGSPGGVGFDEADDPLTGHLPTASSTSTYNTNPGQTLTESAAQGVLAPFSDPNNLLLQAKVLTSPTNGQLTLNADGSFQYVPSAGFIGTDEFTMEASDGEFQSDPTVVFINVVLPAPTLVAPAAGATVTTTTPAFQWSAVPGASFYNLVLIDQAFPNIVATSAPMVTGTSFSFTTPLLIGHAYTWYVQAIATSGSVDWPGLTSNLSYFHVALVGAPTLTAPANGATLTTSTPTLQWTAVTGATNYNVTLIDTTLSTTTQAIYQVSGTSLTVSPGLVNGHSYQWYVQAVDNVGDASGTTNPFSFTVSASSGSGIPATPTLIAPAADATLSSGTPTFQWSTVTGAVGYTLYLEDTTYSVVPTITVVGQLSGTSYTPTSPLFINQVFKWWVTAYDSMGNISATPAPLSFTVGISTPSTVGPSGTVSNLYSDVPMVCRRRSGRLSFWS